MTQVNPQLIADLARLAARYGPEEWDQLIQALEDDQRRAELGGVLSELATASRARRERRPPNDAKRGARAQRVHEELARIRAADPARAELLEDVWLKLRERELLPTLALVRAFAEATGMKGLNSTRREQAVTELMEQIVAMPVEALEQMMRETVVADRKLGEEYERWVSLILRKPPLAAG
jgi:hypothetical protein